MTTEAKLIAAALGTLVLIALGFWGFTTIYDDGKREGSATIQTKWDADRKAIADATANAIAQATKARDEALEANEAIQNDYAQKLSATAAAGADLTQRLRNAEARLAANRDLMPKAGGGQGAPDPGPTASDDRLTSLLGNAFAECAANATQLDALIAEVQPQIDAH